MIAEEKEANEAGDSPSKNVSDDEEESTSKRSPIGLFKVVLIYIILIVFL